MYEETVTFINILKSDNIVGYLATASLVPFLLQLETSPPWVYCKSKRTILYSIILAICQTYTCVEKCVVTHSVVQSLIV